MTIFFRVLLAAALFFTRPLSALAIPEGQLASALDGQVMPFFSENFVFGSFQGSDRVTLRYAKRVPAEPRAALVVVSGRTEFIDKYAELFYDLRELPVSFYIFDQRGQGRSTRLLAEHDKGYVADFQDYVGDLALFIDTVVGADRKIPLLMLTHSMGGVVAGLYANSYPGSVQGMIACALMLDINTAPFPTPVARLLSRGASLLGFGASYVPGGRPYDPAKPFSANTVTHSQARFSLNQKLITITPDNAMGSPTYAWIDQAFAGMDRLQSKHQNLTMPVLFLRPGADTVVKAKPQADFCDKLPDCTLVDLPGARHEILMEEDPIRNRALTLIRDFVNRLAQPAGGGRP